MAQAQGPDESPPLKGDVAGAVGAIVDLARRAAAVRGVKLSLQIGIPAVVIWFVWKEIRGLHFGDIKAAAGQSNTALLVLAAICSLTAVAAMGFYDALAFRDAAGRLTFGTRWILGTLIFGWTNFITLGPFGGPAARLWAYKRFGLTIGEMGHGFLLHYIGLSTGVASWVVALVLPLPGVGAAEIPVRLGLALVLCVASAFWVGRIVMNFAIRRGLDVPGLRSPLWTLGVVSFFDWGLTALAFVFVAQAIDPSIAPVTSARAMLLGHSAGFASMIPGGIGSADAVWMKVLTLDGVDAARAAAVVLVFRFTFYVVPWAASFLLLYVWALSQSERLRFWQRRLMAGAVLIHSLLLLASIATPTHTERLTEIGKYVPLPVLEGAHAASAACAALLLFMIRGLVRGYSSAMIATALVLGASAVAHLLKSGDVIEPSISIVLLGLLLGVRGAFRRRGRLPIGWESALAAGIGGLAFFLVVGVAAFRLHQFDSGLWMSFEHRGEPARFVRGAAVIALVAAVIIVREAARPARPRVYAGPREIDEACEFIRAHARSAASLLVACGDKAVWRWRDRGLVVYQRAQDSMIVLSDPVVASPGDGPALLEDLHEFAAVEDLDLVFFQVTADWLSLLRESGYRFLRLGEEAVVPLEGFTLAAGHFAGLRRAARSVEENGIRFEMLEPPHERAVLVEAREVSDAWLTGRQRREMQFSLGYFGMEYLRRFPLGVARDSRGAMVGFMNVLGLRRGSEASLDLVRHRPGAGEELAEFMIVRTCEWASRRGFAELNLGLAPMARMGAHRRSAVAERLAAMLLRHGERTLHYQGLRAFKDKFHPVWRARFLGYQQPWGGQEAVARSAGLIRAWSGADRARIRAAREVSSS